MDEINDFAIYAAQFDRDDGNEKAFDTTMVGEVNLSNYPGRSPEEACWERLTNELKGAKNRANDPAINHIVNFTYYVIKNVNKKAGADKELHKYFKHKLGINCVVVDGIKSTEEFNLGRNFRGKIEEAIANCFGEQPLTDFKPRENQKKLEEKLDKAFQKYKSFLVGAICRFGKTATLLHYFTKTNPKNRILIISAKCDVKNSWEDDYKKFIGRKEYDFFTKEDIIEKGLPDKSRKCIAWVSFQSAAKDYEGRDINDKLSEESENDYLDENFEKWQNKVVKSKWDVVIIDECHFGSDTERSQKFIDKILKNPDTLKVDVTATYYEKILRHEYGKENSFIYDLQDERRDYDAGKFGEKTGDYSNYVPVHFFHLNLYKLFEQNGFARESRSEEEAIRNKFYNWRNEKFSFSAYFSDGNAGFGEQTIGSHFSQMYNKYLKKQGKNFAIYVNEVAHGNKLANALKRTDEFNVINVCGNESTTIGSLNIQLNESKKPVIIISCGRFLTGSTLTKLHGVILMGTCNSATKYIQYGLRAKNAYSGRKFPCSIFDLNVESFLTTNLNRNNLFSQMAQAKARITEKSVEEVIQEEYNGQCFEIFENEGNIFEKLDNFGEKLQNNWTVGNDGEFDCSEQINPFTIDKEGAVAVIEKFPFENINLTDKKIVVTEKQLEKCKKVQDRNKRNEEPLKRKEDYKVWIAKLYNIINCIPAYMSVYGVSSLNEIIESKSKEVNAFTNFYNTAGLLKSLKDYWHENDKAEIWKELNDKMTSYVKRHLA